MKPIDLKGLKPDPIAAAIASSDKELLTVSGYVCAVNDQTISISDTRDATSYFEYPLSTVIASFSEDESDSEQSGKVILIIDANARIRMISSLKVDELQTQTHRRRPTGHGCGVECQSGDGSAKCCCGVGERCVKWDSGCRCESARSDSGFSPFGRQVKAPVSYGNKPASFEENARIRQQEGPNWQCRTRDGLCPIICYPIVVNGKVVEFFCYCDCSYPIPT